MHVASHPPQEENTDLAGEERLRETLLEVGGRIRAGWDPEHRILTQIRNRAGRTIGKSLKVGSAQTGATGVPPSHAQGATAEGDHLRKVGDRGQNGVGGDAGAGARRLLDARRSRLDGLRGDGVGRGHGEKRFWGRFSGSRFNGSEGRFSGEEAGSGFFPQRRRGAEEERNSRAKVAKIANGEPGPNTRPDQSRGSPYSACLRREGDLKLQARKPR